MREQKVSATLVFSWH